MEYDSSNHPGSNDISVLPPAKRRRTDDQPITMVPTKKFKDGLIEVRHNLCYTSCTVITKL